MITSKIRKGILQKDISSLKEALREVNLIPILCEELAIDIAHAEMVIDKDIKREN
jgi:hypothetical protein